MRILDQRFDDDGGEIRWASIGGGLVFLGVHNALAAGGCHLQASHRLNRCGGFGPPFPLLRRRSATWTTR